MKIVDKNGVLRTLRNCDHVSIELGCGSQKRHPSAIGIDALDYPAVDVVGDVFDVLLHFPDQSVDAVYAYHFIEHVDGLGRLLHELGRIVKPGGEVMFVAPHFSNPYFYSDPTHRVFFGLYTFSYLAGNSPFARKVPTYALQPFFEVLTVDLIFKSSRPFLVRHGIKRLFGGLFNSCNYFRELYEENFCYLFPCYEVRYILRRQEVAP